MDAWSEPNCQPWNYIAVILGDNKEPSSKVKEKEDLRWKKALETKFGKHVG